MKNSSLYGLIWGQYAYTFMYITTSTLIKMQRVFPLHTRIPTCTIIWNMIDQFHYIKRPMGPISYILYSF